MADEPGLRERLADLADAGQRFAAPPAPEEIRARGNRRRRRRRAALHTGGVALTAVLAVGVLSLVRLGTEPDPAAAWPAASSAPFAPPAPAPGEEYADELGYVYDAVPLDGNMVRITVEWLRTGVPHELTVPTETPVEVRQLAGGKPDDMRLGELVGRLDSGPRWVFAFDYDGEGRIQSLREAFWLTAE